MNHSKLAFTALTALTVALSSQLHAESDRSIYGGAKYGSYSFELKGTTSMDDSDGYAFVGGMELQNGLAVEVEYGDSGKADFT